MFKRLEKILEAKFPRSYSLHGGEHVVSLFFSDIAKILEIKVIDCLFDNLCIMLLTFSFNLQYRY